MKFSLLVEVKMSFETRMMGYAVANMMNNALAMMPTWMGSGCH
jgi:hypothetical protein